MSRMVSPAESTRGAITGPPSGPTGDAARAHPSRVGRPAPAVRGVTPSGGEVDVDVGGAGSTLLGFLTSGCGPCGQFWATADDRAGNHAGDHPDNVKLALVTPDPATEDRRAVKALAPSDVPVVMSSEVWNSYGIGRASWFVLVKDGKVAAERWCSSWQDVGALVNLGRPPSC